MKAEFDWHSVADRTLAVMLGLVDRLPQHSRAGDAPFLRRKI
jgi:hypothetical protein